MVSNGKEHKIQWIKIKTRCFLLQILGCCYASENANSASNETKTMAVTPFLSKGASMGELCLICDSRIMAVHDVSKVAENGLQRYRELADK